LAAIESRTSLIRLLKKPAMRAEKISNRFQAGPLRGSMAAIFQMIARLDELLISS